MAYNIISTINHGGWFKFTYYGLRANNELLKGEYCHIARFRMVTYVNNFIKNPIDNSSSTTIELYNGNVMFLRVTNNYELWIVTNGGYGTNNLESWSGFAAFISYVENNVPQNL